ncbi:hypothetical protein EMCRGX_G021085 [Ephydatia muelleri]
MMATSMNDQQEKITRRLSNPELRCKNHCGFYGNPIYSGYCSKCYKELHSQKGPQASPEEETPPSNDAIATTGLQGFTKFEERKNVHTGKRLLKGVVPVTKKSKKPSRSSEPFNEFLKTLKKPVAQDITQHFKTFHEQITKSTASIDEMGEMVQEFYVSTAERLKTHSLFRTMSEEQQEDMMDGIERHLMTNIYSQVYSVPSSDDAMKDLLLKRRIRMLSWLDQSHLAITLDLGNFKVQELVSKARDELHAMDEKKPPLDKLLCISNCCNNVLTALKLSQDHLASADEFVPALIYTVIYSTAEHLYSNLNYISRFSNPNRLMSGETGYYFTNLSAAVSFIENLTAENLKMPQDEFDKKMGFVNGKTDADLLIEEDNAVEDKERVFVLKSYCEGVKEVTARHNTLHHECAELLKKMKDYRTGVREQIEGVLSTPPPKSLYKRNQVEPVVPTGILIPHLEN